MGGPNGETSLTAMLSSLRPYLFDMPYAFETIAPGSALPPDVFATVVEDEGLTIVHPAKDGRWARISLHLHSSLEAVGLTAALSSALAADGISANVIAGAYHDHLFVPWSRRDDAMRILGALHA